MAVKIYDPDQVTIVFGATIIGSGWADGTFVSVEQDEDAFSLYVGTDGEGTRAKSNNASATITFTLAQSALANDLLSAQYNLDLLTPGGVGVVPLLVKDGSGRSLFAAESAWIQKPPRAEYGREVGTREWTIRTDSLVQFHGGN